MIGEARGSVCCPDADHEDRKGERVPNPNAAGSRIMRLQLTVNFKTGTKRRSTRQERGIRRGMEA